MSSPWQHTKRLRAGETGTARRAPDVTDEMIDQLCVQLAALQMKDDLEHCSFHEYLNQGNDNAEITWRWIKHGDGWSWWWSVEHGWWQGAKN